MWFGGFMKLFPGGRSPSAFWGLFVFVFLFLRVFMAFQFLRGGPSAEAGQFLRRSGYTIAIANKRRGAANIWPTRSTWPKRAAPRPRPCITRARSHPRRAHGHARCACAATSAAWRQTGAGPGLGARKGGGERPGLGVAHRRARPSDERVRAHRAAGRREVGVGVGRRLRVVDIVARPARAGTLKAVKQSK